MTDGGQDFDLGQVVGDAGEKGDDGSTIWYTSTAPSYVNNKYTFTISNLNGKTGLEIAVNDIIFYSTYYYIVSAVNTTTVDCSTRVSIKGSDASVTIVDNLTSDSSTSVLSAKQGKVLNTNKIETSAIATSFSSTTSDSKVPSEKLVKTELDKKIATSNTAGLVKNDGTIDTTSYSTFSGSYNDLSNKPTIPSASTTTPSADTSSGSYGSGTSYARSNHTHPKSSLYAEATHSHTKSQITDFPSIPSKTSDLTNDGADGTNVFVANNDSRLTDARTPTSHTHGNLTNDGKLGTTSGKPVITTTGGAITTGSFGSTSGTFAEGNHTHSGYVSATKVTSWQSTPSDSNVPSEKLVKDYVDGLIGSAISYIVGSGS